MPVEEMQAKAMECKKKAGEADPTISLSFSKLPSNGR